MEISEELLGEMVRRIGALEREVERLRTIEGGGTGSGGDLPTPSGQGYILRSNATPEFVEYQANTNGAVLIGDGTDIVSDTTPTIAGLTTFTGGWESNAAAKMNGYAIYLDADDDSYLYAGSDDVVTLVLNGSGGTFYIGIGGGYTMTFDADGLTMASGTVIDLNSVLELRSSGDLTVEADIAMAGDGGISAQGSLTLLMDSDDNTTDARVEIAKDADQRQTGVSGVPVWAVFEDSTIVQRLDAVDHGATSIFKHTDAHVQIEPMDASAGGVHLLGGRDSSGAAGGAVVISGLLDENADTTRSSSGRAVVEVRAGSESSGTWGNMVANGNVFGVRARVGGDWSTVLLVDEDGDVWVPGTIDASDASARLRMSTTGVTDLAPTDEELDGIFGTPATVGSGFCAFVDDGGSHARVWFVTSDGTNWWYSRMYLAGA